MMWWTAPLCGAVLASANTLWGNEASVLVGDFLFSKSFSLMVGVGSLDILRVLSDATTIIAEGEVMQLLCTGEMDLSEERLYRCGALQNRHPHVGGLRSRGYSGHGFA